MGLAQVGTVLGCARGPSPGPEAPFSGFQAFEPRPASGGPFFSSPGVCLELCAVLGEHARGFPPCRLLTKVDLVPLLSSFEPHQNPGRRRLVRIIPTIHGCSRLTNFLYRL